MPPDQPDASAGGPGTADTQWLQQWIARNWRLWRLEIVALAVAAGLAAALLASGLWQPSWVAVGAGVGVAAAVLASLPDLRQVRPFIAAVERATPRLHNALQAWHEVGTEAPPPIVARLAWQVRTALGSRNRPRPTGLWPWLAVLLVATSGAALRVVPHAAPAVHVQPPASRGRAPSAPAAPLTWTATVTPPAYTGRPVSRVTVPQQLAVVEGSSIVLTFSGWPGGATPRLGGAVLPTEADGSGRRASFVARRSDVVLVEARDGRLLASVALVVQADAPPTLRITEPAADLRRGVAQGLVRIGVTARDDIGLHDLRLRFTKVSGSGESFTFEDGEWPVVLRRVSRTAWEGRYVLDLASLALGPGDSVVYHAIAHDARPGSEGAAESERFLIEITRPGALAAGDFSLPEPEQKYALSQRMVIQLTERLLERRPRMRPEEVRAEAQALSIAQRTVRAEFVFMLGGEVQDEVEEAAHSHEVEAGRLDNRGQSDLTDAVRQMAQAERRLTDADLKEALAYEYGALAALQAAFGKARYFMRTLPGATQIDATRRLTGDRDGLADAAWAFAPVPESARRQAVAVLARLERGRGDLDADSLRAIVALETASAAWVARVEAVRAREGRPGLVRLLRARLAAASPAWFGVPLARTDDETALLAAPK